MQMRNTIFSLWPRRCSINGLGLPTSDLSTCYSPQLSHSTSPGALHVDRWRVGSICWFPGRLRQKLELKVGLLRMSSSCSSDNRPAGEDNFPMWMPYPFLVADIRPHFLIPSSSHGLAQSLSTSTLLTLGADNSRFSGLCCAFQDVERHPLPLPARCQEQTPPFPLEATKLSPDIAKCPLGGNPFSHLRTTDLTNHWRLITLCGQCKLFPGQTPRVFPAKPILLDPLLNSLGHGSLGQRSQAFYSLPLYFPSSFYPPISPHFSEFNSRRWNHLCIPNSYSKWGIKYYAQHTNNKAHRWLEVTGSWLAGLADMPISHRCERGGDISFSLTSETQELSSPQAAFYVTSPPSLQEMQRV